MWREWKARETEELFQTEETGETWELDPMHGPGLDPLSRTLSEQLTNLNEVSEQSVYSFVLFFKLCSSLFPNKIWFF